jgi:hypothetical protein
MWNQKQFEEIYSRYQSSGLQVKEFCRNECIKEAKFFYWQRKLRKRRALPEQSPGFVPIVFAGGGPLGFLRSPFFDNRAFGRSRLSAIPAG